MRRRSSACFVFLQQYFSMVRALLPAISATWVMGVPASGSPEMNMPRAVYQVIFSSMPTIPHALSGISLTRNEKLRQHPVLHRRRQSD